jgi:hypothetical protein
MPALARERFKLGHYPLMRRFWVVVQFGLREKPVAQEILRYA